jgi:hypothetical protein
MVNKLSLEKAKEMMEQTGGSLIITGAAAAGAAWLPGVLRQRPPGENPPAAVYQIFGGIIHVQARANHAGAI